MKSYNIHLIRHGSIDKKYGTSYIGTTNIPLSDEGINELNKHNTEYKYPYTRIVFTSPLKRCTQTANILYPDIEPLIIEQLSEMNFGEWESKTAEELKDNPEFVKWLAGDNSTKPPRGESTDNFTRRICNVFQDIVDGLIKTGNTEAVIITHGGIIGLILSVYGIPQAKPFDWQCDNGFGYSLKVTPMLWQRDKVCEVYKLIPEEVETDE